ncbi:MAG: ribonuclease Z [Candidatus Aenigmatarchaeota archaeon]
MMPIEIIFLGTGSGVPTLQRGQPAILLNYGGDYILFDCGEGCQLGLQKAKVSPMKIKRICISHWHADHFAGLLPLIETMHLFGRTEKLEIYGPEASRFMDSLLELSYLGFGFEIAAKDASTDEKKKIFSGTDYEIFSIPAKHSVPAVGYIFAEKDRWNIIAGKAKKIGLSGQALRQIKEKGKISFGGKTIHIADIARLTAGRKIIYSGDTEPCERLFAEKPDLLVHDGTFVEEDDIDIYSHSAAEEVARLAKKHRIKKLILTHLSRRYKTEKPLLKAVKPIFKNAIVAKDGMRIVV